MEENLNDDINKPLQINSLEKMDDSKENEESYILDKERPSNASNYALQNRFTVVGNNFQEDDSQNNDSLINTSNDERPSNQSEKSNSNKTNDNKINNDENKINNNDKKINMDDKKKVIKANKKEKSKTKKKIIDIKLILLGDASVGKSSIIGRYINNSFKDNYQCTLQVELNTKMIDIDLDTIVKMNIWDTAGQEKYRHLTSQYYRSCQGAIIAFDLTRKDSFDGLQKWIDDLENYNTNIPILIVGNKSDLIKDREVNKDDIEKFVKNKYMYYDVSAKNGTNVSLAFDKIRSEMIEDIKRKEKKEEKELNDIKFKMRNLDSKAFDQLNKSVNGKSKKCC
jgi:Ras-related protein Rab-11A